MRQRPRDWAELEQVTGIKRNVARVPTQLDVVNLTYKRLGRWPAWRKKLERERERDS